MIIPFILAQCLDASHFKRNFADTVKENCSLTNLRQVKSEVIRIWSLFAKSCAKVFANEFCYNDYHELDQLLIELIKALCRVIDIK
jgi:hypothetical protein